MLDALPASGLDAAQPDRRAHPRCYSIRPWACVYTHPQAERWANTNLQRAGYQTYLPLITVRRRDRVIRSLWHTVAVPAFNRYLFIRFDHRAASWSPIRATPGVADLVRSGSELHYASEAAVEALRAAEAAAAVALPGRPWIGPGDAVSLATGAFSDHPAVVLQVGKEMALVSLLLFGELREVAVQLDCLSPRID